MKPSFCCPNSHLIKDCKSERVGGVNDSTERHNRLLHSDAQETDSDTKEKNRRLSVSEQGRQSFFAFHGKHGKRHVEIER